VRAPTLAGVLNFRDMGGYAAADGRTVRWKRLYRSGAMHDMTDEDLGYVRRSGILIACDLRSNSERARHPNRLSVVADIEYWCRDHDRRPGDLHRLVLAPDSTASRTSGLMRALYRTLPYEFRDTYAEIFRKLRDGRLPLVFNCAAGKDRTGVLAALVLSALGVPRSVIMQDYLLTENVFEQCCNMLLERRGIAAFAGLSPEVWHPMLRADRSYLNAMFNQLESGHGTAEGYLRDELGVDAAFAESLRSQLLEG